MFSTRSLAPLETRRPLQSYLPTSAAVLRRFDALPHSDNHSRRTTRALYLVGAAQVLTLVTYVGFVLSSFTGDVIPVNSKVLFVVPALVALLAAAMVVIGLMGSLSAPWMAALLSLPIALTALYVEDALASLALVTLLLVPAAWLARELLADADRRAELESQ